MDDKIDIIKFFVILFSPFIALKFLEDADYIYALFCVCNILEKSFYEVVAGVGAF